MKDNRDKQIGAMNTFSKMLPILSASYMPAVTGHGYLSAAFQVSYTSCMKTNFQAEVEYSELSPAFDSFQERNPEENAVFFNQHFNQTKWKTIGEMVDSVVQGCPCSNLDVEPFDVSSWHHFAYQNDEKKRGFIETHHGPCAATIDGVQQFYDHNCVITYPAYPAIMDISYDSCVKEKCIFIFYHVALQDPKPQFYSKNVIAWTCDLNAILHMIEKCATITNPGLRSRLASV